MAKKTERQGFVLYHDIRKPLEKLDDAQRGRLFLAILNYSEKHELPEFDDAALDISFAFIQQALDNAADAWEETRRKRAISGSLGGKQKVANLANATSAIQEVANQAEGSKSSNLELEHEPKQEHKQKKKAAPFVPPTLEEVRAYCKQRNSTVDPDQFYNYFTADPERQWIDAKGNPVTSWKQKLLTWEKYDHKQKTAGDDLRESYNMMQGWAANG